MTPAPPAPPAPPARPKPTAPGLVVLTNPEDLPAIPLRTISADAFLQGDGVSARETVLNLCRTHKDLSKGYYVSLVADARGLRVIPGVDTLKLLDDAAALFRALDEAPGVKVVTPEEMTHRRRELARGRRGRGPAPAGGRRDPAPWVVRELDHEKDVRYRPARPAERREEVLVLGRVTSRSLARLGAAVFRACPVPLLRLGLLKEQGVWKVVEVTQERLADLDEAHKRLLVRELRRPQALARAAARRRPDPRLSLAILYDARSPYAPSTAETIEKIERTAERMGVHTVRLAPDGIARLADHDALFIRALTGLGEPAFRFAARAEALGMPVVDDPQSIIRCGNKVFLHELLKREGVPTPPTWITPPSTPFRALAERLGTPFIIKLPEGSFSTAVRKVATEAEYRREAKAMGSHSPLLIAQAYMPTDFDWRVTTLGGKVLFVCKYHMARGHWQIRAADARGVRYGRVEAVARDYAPREVVRTALKAARLVGEGMYGVDLKEGPDGPVVIEVNDNPNLDVGYDDAADGNVIYEDLIDHFLRRAGSEEEPERRRRPAPRPEGTGLTAPIGPRHRRLARTPYKAFEVCGVEIEYALVDRDLNVLHAAEDVLAALAGHPASDAELGAVAFSNEIVDHVLELKIPVPVRSLAHAEPWLAEAAARVADYLAAQNGARLLPTGMHPWFDPRGARMWRRSNQAVYGAYERLFDTRTHGWANVQALHVNLPLGREEDAVRLMNASALLVPYLPALAASSPLYEGEVHGAVDCRLAWILEHQARIPESMGRLVPEYIQSLKEYRQRVLRPMYAAVDRLPGAGALRHEFLNARGAVIKASRDSLEVRIVDAQECVRMDLALAVFTRAALEALSAGLAAGRIALPEPDRLVEDLTQAIYRGSAGEVHAPHLGGGGSERIPMREALRRLLALARSTVRKDEEELLALIEPVVERGSLSERILGRLEPHLADDEAFTDEARRIYVQLSDCVRANEPWSGR